ncbi:MULTISPECIES: ABC transporter permease [Paenibacillus]|jgi:peptide/nickel transport system permease protein|uniref:ABC transporter permease n=1 Tax=Paenibacillus TaxID=44249 RepID=UPI000D918D0A|nr:MULTISPECIES: ABC transporter permease [Paenibacillus]MDP9675903.1 peptide/nickel transport system permease protein [Paenibacillus jamilae]KAF6618545.1 ABC transporter permease [Paenibacillus sp. EKM101P]KAF6624891.1 ABC transporter permease [Paenibacillus sp. EKM102P]KAF6635331.1 ABC transporter permease [Paenibacillus sp. EKM10P]KAF6648961.1 ABC transporter permease [Paenibacillus sp. EKM11P]
MYILKRLFTMLITLWIIVTLTFIIMHIIPGDPFSNDSKTIPEAVLQNMRARYNLDKPLAVQYVLYLKNLLVLDMGPSIQSKTTDVNMLIARGFPPSALLGIQSIVVAIIAGISLGTLAALHHNRPLDYISMFIAIVGISVPSFILAPLLIKYVAVKWHLLPVASWGTWQHTVLPSLALAVSPLAVIARFMRTSMLEVMHEEYIRTAKAKGLSSWAIVIRHGLRNALIPVLSFIGPLFASVITGTFVVEKIFAIPGIGKYFVDSIFNRDYPVIMGTTIFYSAILVVTLFLIDISYRLVDPRIQLVSKGD